MTLLSQSTEEQVKQMLKPTGAKPSPHLLPTCAVNARSRLAEEKIHLESKQAELLNLWRQDENLEILQQTKEKKQNSDLYICLRNQLADNRRRLRGKKSKEDEQNCRMMNHIMKKFCEDDANKTKKTKDHAISPRTEVATFMAIKNAWEKEYKEALKHEDDKFGRIVAEKEAQRRELLDKQVNRYNNCKINKILMYCLCKFLILGFILLN